MDKFKSRLAWLKTLKEAEPTPISWRRLAQSGDGFVYCSDGATRWGLFGAAGVLFVYNSPDEPLYFLIERGATEEPGTWGLPGGALEEGERPEDGALRETQEELGFLPRITKELNRYTFQPCPEWSYTTVIYEVAEPFEVQETNWEVADGGWFTAEEIRTSNLIHPPLQQTFNSGHLRLARPTLTVQKFVLVDGKLNVAEEPSPWFGTNTVHHVDLLDQMPPARYYMNEGGYIYSGGEIWGTQVRSGDLLFQKRPDPEQMTILREKFPQAKRVIWPTYGVGGEDSQPESYG